MNKIYKSNRNMKRFRRSLSVRIFRKYILTSVIFSVSMAVFLVISKVFLSRYIWYEDSMMYQLFHWIDRNALFTIIFVSVVGWIIIFFYYGLRTFRYLERLIYATEELYESEDLIHLPDELKEVENILNEIKLKIQRNERAAREAEQRKNDLVVYLAHDLKTPLTSIIGYLSLLTEENGISPELRQKYLSITLDSAKRLEDLINEFFEITRFNLTHITLELTRVNIKRLFEQIVFEFGPVMREKNLTCAIDAGSDLMIRCDGDKIQRVFDNLVRNAVNYSFPGTEILLRVKENADNIICVCENHGNTIPEEKLERIFEQFYRLDAARATRSGGAGLGLAIAKEIVELHGGRIRAESRNEMIRFTVVLPKAPATTGMSEDGISARKN